MIAFKKAIFVLLSFLLVFGGLLVIPSDAFAVPAYKPHCGKWIDSSNNSNVSIPGNFFKSDPDRPLMADGKPIPGALSLAYFFGDTNGFEFTGPNGERIKGDLVGYKVNCAGGAGDSNREAVSIEYKVEHNGFTIAGEEFSYALQTLNSSGYATGDSTNTGKAVITSTVDNTIKSAITNAFDDLGTKIEAFAQTALAYVLAGIAIIINWINHVVVGIAGALFEVSLTQTVANLGEYIGAGSETGKAIEQSWLLFKNLANLIFIFLILFVAIKIILRGNGFGDKRLLGGIVVIALFMNFSLLFTKTFINVSNALSISIYNAITYDDTTQTRKSIGVTLVSHLNLTTFSSPNLPEQMSKIEDDFTENSLQFIMALFSVPLFWITALGLAFTAGSLILRMISFIFLMILSPLAFIAAIIPGMKSFWTKWLDKLVSNSISLPVLLIFLYLTLILAEGVRGSFVQSGAAFSDLYGVLSGVFTSTSTAQLVESAAKSLVGVITLIINYAIIMASLFFAFWGSRKIGISGASWATAAADTKTKMVKYGMKPAQGGARATGRAARKTAGRVSGVVGRSTVGAAGSFIANNKLTQGTASKDGILGALARRVEGGGKAVAGASFGGAAGGYAGAQARVDEREKEAFERRKKLGEYRGGKEQKIKTNYDNAKGAYDESMKKRKEKEKAQRDNQTEESRLINELVGMGVVTDDRKLELDTAKQVISTLEKKQKKTGSLSPDETTKLNKARTSAQATKTEIFDIAAASPIVSKDMEKVIHNVQNQTTSLENDIAKARKTEVKTKAAWIDTQESFAKIKNQVEARVKKFDQNMSDKTTTVLSQMIKSNVGKVAIAAGTITAAVATGGIAPVLAGSAVVAGSVARRNLPKTARNKAMTQYSNSVAAGRTSASSSSKPSTSSKKPGSSSSTT